MTDRPSFTSPKVSPTLKLSPTMTSRKLLTMQFIRQYFAEHGVSPTLGEIAAGTGASRKRVFEVVGTLVRQGQLVKVPGEHRGIRLVQGVTASGISPVPVLDHFPRLQRGVGNGSEESKAA